MAFLTPTAYNRLVTKHTLTLQKDICFRGGKITGYLVRGLPDREEAYIRDFGVPIRTKWQISRIKGGVQSDWTGNYESAEAALAELQKEYL